MSRFRCYNCRKFLIEFYLDRKMRITCLLCFEYYFIEPFLITPRRKYARMYKMFDQNFD